MKKALIVACVIIAVFILFGVGYYFGYSATEPETQLVSPDITGPPPGETVEVSGLNTIVFNEEEINSLMSQVMALVAESGLPVKLNYVSAKLTEDRIFVSVSAEVMDMKIEAEDIEVIFQDTDVSVSGKVPLAGIDTSFSVRAELGIIDGKLTIAVKDIKPAAVSFMLLYGRGISLDELNQYLNQKLTSIPFTLPFQELKEIAVEGRELMIRGR